MMTCHINTYRIREHCAKMRSHCEKGENLKYDHVNELKKWIRTWQEGDISHYEFGVQY